MKWGRYLAIASIVVAALVGGWLSGAASTRRDYDRLLMETAYLDAASRLKLSLNLIEEVRAQDTSRVVSSLERLADFSVTELATYGKTSSGANQEIIRAQLQRLQQYQLATHGSSNPAIAAILQRLER